MLFAFSVVVGGGGVGVVVIVKYSCFSHLYRSHLQPLMQLATAGEFVVVDIVNVVHLSFTFCHVILSPPSFFLACAFPVFSHGL